MHINARIKQLEREADKKTSKKYMKIEIEMGNCCCDEGNCNKCKNQSKLPVKEFVNGELIINVGADVKD